jgi:coatomer protein complex subunit epsilon
MDPFSAEGGLLNLHNFFHQGQYQEAVDFDTAGLSPENAIPARVLSLRAQIALGNAEEVIADVQGENDVELVAVGALAELEAGNESKAVQIAEKLAEASSDNGVVQVLAGIVLQKAGKSEEALALLSKHQGNRAFFLEKQLGRRRLPHHSRSRRSDRLHPPRTKSHRSCDQGSKGCEKMGAR